MPTTRYLPGPLKFHGLEVNFRAIGCLLTGGSVCASAGAKRRHILFARLLSVEMCVITIALIPSAISTRGMLLPLQLSK
jgi:hypothetical protein